MPIVTALAVNALEKYLEHVLDLEEVLTEVRTETRKPGFESEQPEQQSERIKEAVTKKLGADVIGSEGEHDAAGETTFTEETIRLIGEFAGEKVSKGELGDLNVIQLEAYMKGNMPADKFPGSFAEKLQNDREAARRDPEFQEWLVETLQSDRNTKDKQGLTPSDYSTAVEFTRSVEARAYKLERNATTGEHTKLTVTIKVGEVEHTIKVIDLVEQDDKRSREPVADPDAIQNQEAKKDPTTLEYKVHQALGIVNEKGEVDKAKLDTLITMDGDKEADMFKDMLHVIRNVESLEKHAVKTAEKENEATMSA